MSANANKLVLVSGASGYLGSHCVRLLLTEGYKVRGTVRSLKNEDKVQPIRELCPEAKTQLELVEADLLKEETWPNAVKNCDYVLHTASPFPPSQPKNEDELIKPAVDGTLNVLKACAKEFSVKRVVVTSSLAAVMCGYDRNGRIFTENDWTKLDGPHVNAYEKSKTLAERAAYDFVKNIKDGENKFELSTVCPSWIIGPMLHKTECTSAQVLKKMMHREMPMIPRLSMPTVDVRDVALCHMKAMEMPEAAGQRYACTTKTIWIKEVCEALSKEFAPLGYNIPTIEAPYPLLWLISWFDKLVANFLHQVGEEAIVENKKIREALGMKLRSVEQGLVDMGHSLIEKGIVKKI